MNGYCRAFILAKVSVHDDETYFLRFVLDVAVLE